MEPLHPLSEVTPEYLCDARMREMVSSAISRIRGDLERLAPFSAAEVNDWMGAQTGRGGPVECFCGLKAHFLLIPWYVETRIQKTVDPAFQRELVYSSINAYFFARLLDNVTDGHSPGDAKLLPIGALFHSNFQLAYSRWFLAESPFWNHFERLWVTMADATIQQAEIRVFSEADFIAVSSQKIAAVKIPVTAVCLKYQRPDLVEPWLNFYDCFACFHEMLDDFLDWHSDLAEGRSSFLLSEARRLKREEESIDAYFLRAGLEGGYLRIKEWLGKASILAQALDSELLNGYLEYRSDQLARFWDSLSPSLVLLSRMATVLEGDSHAAG